MMDGIVCYHMINVVSDIGLFCVTSGVLEGIRGYTAYTNLRGFFDSVYSPR